MTLEECYAVLDGSYADVMKRLKRKAVVVQLLHMFVQEDLFAQLKAAMAAGDVQAAFRTAHSLKGNCMSLGFTHLQKWAERMMQPLRSGDLDEAESLLESLEREYERTLSIIRRLDA